MTQWYALVVRSNRAFVIRDQLRELGIDEFLPTYTERIQWSDRVKTVDRQLFPGYLFAKLNGDVSEVLTLPGVLQLLPNSLQPIPIEDSEISSLKTVIASELPMAHVTFVKGETIMIRRGPLTGVCGVVSDVVARKQGSVRLIVGIEMLGRAVSVTVDAEDLERAA